MLELAYLNQAVLKEIYARCLTREEFKYYFIEPYLEYDLVIEPTEWRRIQYVSKTGKGEIIGYLGAFINRAHNIVENLELINFTGKACLTFSRDTIGFFELLFCKRQFRKIIIKPLAANPGTRMYEKFILGYDLGYVVGTLKNQCLLHDGKYYNQVIFEMHREKFEAWIKSR